VFLNPKTEVPVFPYIGLMIADKSNNLPSSHHHHSLVSKCETLITHFLLFDLIFFLSTECRGRKVSSEKTVDSLFLIWNGYSFYFLSMTLHPYWLHFSFSMVQLLELLVLQHHKFQRFLCISNCTLACSITYTQISVSKYQERVWFRIFWEWGWLKIGDRRMGDTFWVDFGHKSVALE